MLKLIDEQTRPAGDLGPGPRHRRALPAGPDDADLADVQAGVRPVARAGGGPRALRPHDLRPGLPAGPAAGRGGRAVRHRLLLGDHRRAEHVRRLGHARLQRQADVSRSSTSYLLPITDQTLPTLLDDLDARGLLDDTLVVWVGEFGRTPRINNMAGRDHWPQCYTALLAGGGVKRGYVHGASDRIGAYPAQRRRCGPTTCRRRCSTCWASTRTPRCATR